MKLILQLFQLQKVPRKVAILFRSLREHQRTGSSLDVTLLRKIHAKSYILFYGLNSYQLLPSLPIFANFPSQLSPNLPMLQNLPSLPIVT